MLDALDNFVSISADTWERLRRGKADSRHPFHCPAVATAAGEPGLTIRTIVLRKVDEPTLTLNFHTDTRSPKFDVLKIDPSIALLFYDVGSKLQFRVQAAATLHTNDAIAEDSWNQSAPSSRICYRTPLIPGSVLPAMHTETPPTTSDGREHFAVVRCRVTSIDWLYLKHEGHRRARLIYQHNELTGEWLAP